MADERDSLAFGRTFEATPVVGESTHTAYLDAEAWLVKKHDAPDSPAAPSSVP
jgi:hypothetical protein